MKKPVIERNGQTNGHNGLNGHSGNQPEGEPSRYSDHELEEFREIILVKLDRARSDLKMLTSLIQNENGTDDTGHSFKILEEAPEVNAKERNGIQAFRQEKFITALENALVRVDNKSYGICRVTGKLISKPRLRSVPHATMEVAVKNSQSEQARNKH
jgi:RNA polymerase-binding transcription factor DksA